jgi:protein O-mannosyl-transferase
MAKKFPNRRTGTKPGWPSWWPIAALGALAAVAYWNSFDVPLVFDDFASIQRNDAVQFGDFLKWSNIFSTSIFHRSVLYFTFALNYKLGGQNVWGYHLANLLLHLGNAILLYFIAKQMFSQLGLNSDRVPVYSVLSASFFLAHPIQTESVSYISSRSELLSTSFYLVAFLLFVRRSGKKVGFLFALLLGVFFVLGLGTKETVVSLPATVIVYDWLFLSNARFSNLLQRWRFYSVFVLGAVLLGYYVSTHALAGVIGPAAPSTLPVYPYFLTQLRVIVRYMRLIAFPVGLNLQHDIQPPSSFFDPAVLACALVVLSMLLVAFQWRRKKPLFSFSILWFFLTLAPTSSVVPIRDVIFEHRLYLPMAGLSLSFPFVLVALSDLARSRLKLAWSPIVVGVGVVVTLAIGTVLRNEVWRDEVRLWSDVAAKSPHKEWSYFAIARHYATRGDYQRALEFSVLGAQNVPKMRADFFQWSGTMCLQMHRYDEAVNFFENATKQSTDAKGRANAYYNLGNAYVNMLDGLSVEPGKPGDPQVKAQKEVVLSNAEEAFKNSLRADSFLLSFDALVNIANYRGTSENLLADLQAKLADHEDFQTYYGLGKLHLLAGRYEEATRHFEKAERLNSNEKLLYYYDGIALSEIGKTETAIEKFLIAIRLDPVYVEPRYSLGLLYVKKTDFADAISQFQDILRQNPRHIGALLNLAKIYSQLGQRTVAREYLATLLNISPDNPEATTLWQETAR